MEERFLLFSAAGEGFAFNLRQVCEVMEPRSSFPIPRVPRHFIGLIDFHGTLTALVDLGLYLGRQVQGAPGKVLVLDAKLASLAVTVDAVRSIITGEEINERTPGGDPLTAEILETAYGTFRLLRLDALLFGLEQGLLPPEPNR